MTNRDLAAALFNIATLLRDRQDNPYRFRAYENGARTLMARRDGLAAALRDADQTLPLYIGALMQTPGVGPRLAERLHKELGVETSAELALAARAGHVQSVWGVGEKRSARWA
jgi:DNA polymerase/3'-5' exonuclease PolX